MEINTITFLFLFLPLLLLSKLLVPKKYENILIIILGLIFYSGLNIIYVLMIFFATNINYIFTKELIDNDKYKKRIFIFLIIFNILLILIPFIILKEKNFMIILLSLELISYVINTYKRNELIEKKYINFLANSFLFPRGLGTNINTYNKTLDERKNNDPKLTNIFSGIKYIFLGLIINNLLANNLGELFLEIKTLKNISLFTSILGIISAYFYFIFKIYSYYLSYKGIEKILGFDVENNFDEPLISKSISEFMKKWYSTMNNWVKETIYNNLTSPKITILIYYLIIMTIWILTGLFYQTNLNGIIFGLLIGIILIIESNLTKIKLNKVYKIFTNILIVLLVFLLIFNNLGEYFNYIKNIILFFKYPIINKTFFYLLYNHIFVLIIAICIYFRIDKYIKIKPTLEYKIFINALFIALSIISIAYMFSSYYNLHIIF